MTAFEMEALARFEEISANLVELASWVVVGAFAASFLCGLVVLRIVLAAKNERKVW